jgi:hypothetical protein
MIRRMDADDRLAVNSYTNAGALYRRRWKAFTTETQRYREIWSNGVDTPVAAHCSNPLCVSVVK